MSFSFKELTAVFALEAHNFKVLHWMAKGKQFDRIHVKLASDYYDMVSDDLDVVAELGMRLDEGVPNYAEVIKLLMKTDCCEYEIIEAEDVDYETFVEKADKILHDIITSIICVYKRDDIQNDVINVGIKSTLEGLLEKYDLQYRYLNKRRKP